MESVDVCGWQVRDELLRENEQLRGRVELQGEQLTAMRAHIGIIRQHTITFILDQMDTLHMQRDTEVWRRRAEVVHGSFSRGGPPADRPTDTPISLSPEPRAHIYIFCDADFLAIGSGQN